MERHLQTFILTILVALVAWAGNTMLELRDSTVELKADVSAVKRDVAEINRRFDQYLPRTEADAQFRVEQAKHDEIDRRLDTIERRQGARP